MCARRGTLTRADSITQFSQPSGEAHSWGEAAMAGKGSRSEGANETNVVRVAKDMEGQVPGARGTGNIRVRDTRAHSSMVAASAQVRGGPASTTQRIGGGSKVLYTHKAGG